jgi:hypothetical protein
MSSKTGIQGGGWNPQKPAIIAKAEPAKPLPVVSRPDVSKEGNKSKAK